MDSIALVVLTGDGDISDYLITYRRMEDLGQIDILELRAHERSQLMEFQLIQGARELQRNVMVYACRECIYLVGQLQESWCLRKSLCLGC